MALAERPRHWGGAGRWLVVIAVSAIALSSCGPPAFDYLRDSSGRAMFRVPGQWTTFDQTALYRDQFPNSSFESARNATSGSWTVAFDASPTPSIKDLLGLTAYPTGFAKSRPATAAERTSLKTPAGLRNAVIPIDQQQKANPDLVHVISSQNLKLSSGYRGVRVVFTIQEDPTAPGLEINQTAIVDPGIQNLYLLVIGCDQTCYANSGPAIQQVVGSWTVKES